MMITWLGQNGPDIEPLPEPDDPLPPPGEEPVKESSLSPAFIAVVLLIGAGLVAYFGADSANVARTS